MLGFSPHPLPAEPSLRAGRSRGTGRPRAANATSIPTRLPLQTKGSKSHLPAWGELLGLRAARLSARIVSWAFWGEREGLPVRGAKGGGLKGMLGWKDGWSPPNCLLPHHPSREVPAEVLVLQHVPGSVCAWANPRGYLR